MRVDTRIVGVVAVALIVTGPSIGTALADPIDPGSAWTQAVQSIAQRDAISTDQATMVLVAMLTPSYNHPNPNVQRWYSTALDAGWSPSQWRWLSCVIQRESGGWEWVHNTRDPRKGSLGLMQINSVNTRFLQSQGIINAFPDLADPLANLRGAKALYDRSGPSPWRSRRHSC